jgi:hypothetical protein
VRDHECVGHERESRNQPNRFAGQPAREQRCDRDGGNHAEGGQSTDPALCFATPHPKMEKKVVEARIRVIVAEDVEDALEAAARDGDARNLVTVERLGTDADPDHNHSNEKLTKDAELKPAGKPAWRSLRQRHLNGA